MLLEEERNDRETLLRCLSAASAARRTPLPPSFVCLLPGRHYHCKYVAITMSVPFTASRFSSVLNNYTWVATRSATIAARLFLSPGTVCDLEMVCKSTKRVSKTTKQDAT